MRLHENDFTNYAHQLPLVPLSSPLVPARSHILSLSLSVIGYRYAVRGSGRVLAYGMIIDDFIVYLSQFPQPLFKPPRHQGCGPSHITTMTFV